MSTTGPLLDEGAWLEPAVLRAAVAAVGTPFSIGVPDRDALQELATHLSDVGESHAGVQFATIGWILPMLHDPDVHEVRFSTIAAHTEVDPGARLGIDDATRTAQAGQARWLAQEAAMDQQS
jgi:hypothetical protein